MRLLTLGIVLLLAADARADEPRCGTDTAADCWDWLDIFSSTGTVLGVRGTGSVVEHPGGHLLDGGVLATYMTEHYATHGAVSGHIALSGSIGGASAGTEGSLRSAVDFGWRGTVAEGIGPFVRGGVGALMLGHDRLALSMLEPFQVRIGVQALDDETLLEVGLTEGLVGAGSYRAGPSPGTNLAGSPEFGGYVAARVQGVRIDLGIARLPSLAVRPGTGATVATATVCGFPRPAAVCADVLYARGPAGASEDADPVVGAIYLGLTVGLTP